MPKIQLTLTDYDAAGLMHQLQVADKSPMVIIADSNHYSSVVNAGITNLLGKSHGGFYFPEIEAWLPLPKDLYVANILQRNELQTAAAAGQKIVNVDADHATHADFYKYAIDNKNFNIFLRIKDVNIRHRVIDNYTEYENKKTFFADELRKPENRGIAALDADYGRQFAVLTHEKAKILTDNINVMPAKSRKQISHLTADLENQAKLYESLGFKEANFQTHYNAEKTKGQKLSEALTLPFLKAYQLVSMPGILKQRVDVSNPIMEENIVKAFADPANKTVARQGVQVVGAAHVEEAHDINEILAEKGLANPQGKVPVVAVMGVKDPLLNGKIFKADKKFDYVLCVFENRPDRYGQDILNLKHASEQVRQSGSLATAASTMQNLQLKDAHVVTPALHLKDTEALKTK